MGSPYPLLHNRRFLALWAARTVSVAGDGFGRVALAFGIMALPGSSPGRLSLVLAAQALPLVLLVLPGGVIADRVPRARLMVAAELLAALSWLGLTVLIGLQLPVWWVMTLCAFGAGTGSALLYPALTGLTPEVVPTEQLRQANAWVRVGHSCALTLGLAASGIMVAAAGAPWALALNMASFLLSAGLLASLGHVRVPTAADRRSPLTELMEGGKEFFSHQWLWVIALQFALLVAARQAEVGVLGPVVAERSLGGAKAWGLSMGPRQPAWSSAR